MLIDGGSWEMNLDSVLDTLFSAAAALKEPLQDTVSHSLKLAYGAAKNALQREFGLESAASRALDSATEKPECPIRRAALVDETSQVECKIDNELERLIGQLQRLLKKEDRLPAGVRVSGHNNRVQVAGRDLVINTARNVRRNAICPDERHLSGSQLEAVRKVIKEVSGRIRGVDEKTRFAAVHHMLQRRFCVSSYLLIPRESADEALRYLKHWRAVLREGLRHRRPAVYRNDLYRSIYSGSREMKWDRFELYAFAKKALQLPHSLMSLKQLSDDQLSLFCRMIRCEVGRFRAAEYSKTCASQMDLNLGRMGDESPAGAEASG